MSLPSYQYQTATMWMQPSGFFVASVAIYRPSRNCFTRGSDNDAIRGGPPCEFHLLHTSGNHIRRSCRLDACPHVMRADHMRSLQDHRCLGSERAVEPLIHRCILPVARQHASDKRFPRDAGQQRVTQLMKFVEAPQHGIVLLEILSEAEPGIEHHALTL